MQATSSLVLPSIADTTLYIQINKHPEDMFCVLLADFVGSFQQTAGVSQSPFPTNKQTTDPT